LPALHGNVPINESIKYPAVKSKRVPQSKIPWKTSALCCNHKKMLYLYSASLSAPAQIRPPPDPPGP
jgi:hypothetical protein